MTIKKLAMVCLIPLSISCIYVAKMPKQQSDQISEMSKSDKLKSEIVAEYERLRKSDELKINQQENDITDVLKMYIAIGSSFDEAEKTLTEAGFKFGARPGSKAVSNWPERYDFYANSGSIIKSPAFGIGIEVFVLLRPVSPDDYSKIVSLRAKINTRAF